MSEFQDGYRNTERIDYLANFPGARRERDTVVTEVEGTVSSDLVDDINRLLGAVRPADGTVWTVEQQATVDVATPNPIDASAAPIELGTWSAGTLSVQEDTPLDVSGATVPIQQDTPLDVSGATVTVSQANAVDVADRAGRDLGAVSTPDQPGYATVEINETLAADGSTSVTVEAAGVTELTGTVTSTGQYDVSVEWTLSDGTTLDTTNLATDRAGGDPLSVDEVAGSDRAVVTITDKSSAQQTVQGAITLA